MKFKEKIQEYLKTKNIAVGKIEQDGGVESVVFHILKEDNEKVDKIKDEMEKELNVAVLRSENYGMNVVIVEANDLD